jgi:hypothetical protein
MLNGDDNNIVESLEIGVIFHRFPDTTNLLSTFYSKLRTTFT